MNIQVSCATPEVELYANVHATSRLCRNWLLQSPAHDGHAVLVGGGPSLVDKLPLLKTRHALGQTIFALNGACRFLNDEGIVPDYQVFLDANTDMVSRVGKAKHYLVASQCAPRLVQYLMPNVTLWHFALPELERHIPDYDRPFNLIGGRVSVGLTSMCLAYTMGYRKLHLFGYDSSNKAGKDHAYDVPKTEERLGGQILNSVKVTYGGREFESTLSMAYQAEQFPKVCNDLIDAGCVITLDCDGLIMAVLDDMQSRDVLAA